MTGKNVHCESVKRYGEQKQKSVFINNFSVTFPWGHLWEREVGRVKGGYTHEALLKESA